MLKKGTKIEKTTSKINTMEAIIQAYTLDRARNEKVPNRPFVGVADGKTKREIGKKERLRQSKDLDITVTVAELLMSPRV